MSLEMLLRLTGKSSRFVGKQPAWWNITHASVRVESSVLKKSSLNLVLHLMMNVMSPHISVEKTQMTLGCLNLRAKCILYTWLSTVAAQQSQYVPLIKNRLLCVCVCVCVCVCMRVCRHCIWKCLNYRKHSDWDCLLLKASLKITHKSSSTWLGCPELATFMLKRWVESVSHFLWRNYQSLWVNG